MSIKKIEGYRVFMNQQLGFGSFGRVYKAEADTTKEQVAIKVINKSKISKNQYMKNALLSQIKILESINSPNIVGFYDVMESSKNYYIVLQLCNGDLRDKIRAHKNGFEEKQAIDMLSQIVNGFLSLVKEGISHRDLKPANIMLKDNILKVGDFGYAKKVEKNQTKMFSAVGTPLYMPLEVLKQQEYTSKCDIWALGCIFYEMLHAVTPFQASSSVQLTKKIQHGKLQIYRKDLHPNTRDFILKCLKVYEKDRMSWDELFTHPIFNGKFSKQRNSGFLDKFKYIMGELRIKVTLQNKSLKHILEELGYRQGSSSLNLYDFRKFLKSINPFSKDEEITYLFEKIDAQKTGRVSIKQIQQIMSKNNIPFSQQRILQTSKHKQIKDNQELQKVRNCFQKLGKIVKKNNLNLEQIFSNFDREKTGSISCKELGFMLKKIDPNLSNQQISSAFELIDEDKSNTIEISQFKRYFQQVNRYILSQIQQQQMDIESPNKKDNPFDILMGKINNKNPNKKEIPYFNQNPNYQNPHGRNPLTHNTMMSPINFVQPKQKQPENGIFDMLRNLNRQKK